MAGFMNKILKGSNDREIKQMLRKAAAIDALEPELQALSDDQLRERTAQLRQRAQNGEDLDKLLIPAFALVREAAVRTIGERHYPVQLVGGMVLHQGRIAEMYTGEGKTLLATLPAFLNALSGKGVHVVTVNEYLARRDSEWMGKIYRFLGLEVGLIVSQLTAEQRKAAYAADITYGTNSEFGFDYLRDNMAPSTAHVCQRKLNYAIVDEVDSILIDEARTPLIISGPGEKSTDLYERADSFVRRLRMGEDADYVLDEKKKTINLTEAGIARAESHFGVDNWADPDNLEYNHHVNAALRANYLMKRDVDYVVQDGEVLIVDEFTGRLMIGRRYNNGLHQAIEAKEHVTIARENRTLATITYQNYFRMYDKLSGMTGTAKTEESEFVSIYNMDVVAIPTNRPMIRRDEQDVIYRTEAGKFNAVVEEIVKVHQTGQPILVGTISVEKSELLSNMLRRRGVPHQVLNAKNHEREASIVAQAGKLGAVTIATNMAGRGTDIKLGGSAEALARAALARDGMADELIEAATTYNATQDQQILDARQAYRGYYERFKAQTEAEKQQVIAVGGLHIIGTERHESRRIDNQLRGRAGRQGDPGSTRFYVALEDDLMRLFGGERISGMIERLAGEDVPLEYGMLTKSIERAQKRIESINFQRRKHVLEYDDVMNQQRQIIYAQRNQVLAGEDVHDQVMDMLRNHITDMAHQYCQGRDAEEWNLPMLCAEWGRMMHNEQLFSPQGFADNCINANEVAKRAIGLMEQLYQQKAQEVTQAGYQMAELERMVLLRIVDSHWMDHIDAMDQLRDGIGLRGYAQRDPVVEYKQEGFEMFDSMIDSIREQTAQALFGVRVESEVEKRRARERQPLPQTLPRATPKPAAGSTAPKAPQKAAEKPGRNQPCPCGSGKKYKHCCGA